MRLIERRCEVSTTCSGKEVELTAVIHQLSSELPSVDSISLPSGNSISKPHCSGLYEIGVFVGVCTFAFG